MRIVMVIKSLGMLFTLMGIAYFLRPDIIKKLMGFFKKGKRIYLAGLLRFALAIVFLIAARECGYPWIIIASGLIFLAGGLLIFLLGPEKIRRILDWYQDQPALIFRIIALIVLTFGIIIILSA
ncbi:MAG: hypothetical protein JXA81_01540 [Sedimentisphaerales bacterium]|nr:hypothetical protein [Sedimentisphaerales bacterium]